MLGLSVMLAGIALMFSPMFMDHDKFIRMSVIVSLSLVFGGLFAILVGVIVSNWISSLAVPVTVQTLPNGAIYYEFRSMRYQQFLANRVNPQHVL
jgi:hypothetical protein